METNGSKYFSIESEAQSFEKAKKKDGCWTFMQSILTKDLTRVDKYKVSWEKIGEVVANKMPDGHYLNEEGRSIVVYGEY